MPSSRGRRAPAHLRRLGYPEDWPEIAERVKERAGWRCETCGARHGAWGARDRAGRLIEVDREEMRRLGHGLPPFRRRLSRGGYVKVVEIMLQAAHLDGVPANVEDTNLRALCQKCHLAYDLGQHMRNAASTRRASMATLDMFEATQIEPERAR